MRIEEKADFIIEYTKKMGKKCTRLAFRIYTVFEVSYIFHFKEYYNIANIIPMVVDDGHVEYTRDVMSLTAPTKIISGKI